MAFVASSLSGSGLSRAHSNGPKREQYLTYTCASGDTSGTVTADRLSYIQHLIINGVVQTALPTYSGNVATVAFADPLATIFGQIIAIGV